jgi:hypothetical protein
MDSALRTEIEAILTDASDLTIATLRADGYPQATTVSYASDGLRILFGTAADSQKAQNIARDARVSLTVNLPYSRWSEIRGLSLGGRATRVAAGSAAFERAGALLLRKFPEIAQYVSGPVTDVALFEVVPEIVSILDYRKGFGHTELVRVPEGEAEGSTG